MLPCSPIISNTVHIGYFKQPSQKGYNGFRRGIVDSDKTY